MQLRPKMRKGGGVQDFEKVLSASKERGEKLGRGVLLPKQEEENKGGGEFVDGPWEVISNCRPSSKEKLGRSERSSDQEKAAQGDSSSIPSKGQLL